MRGQPVPLVIGSRRELQRDVGRAPISCVLQKPRRPQRVLVLHPVAKPQLLHAGFYNRAPHDRQAGDQLQGQRPFLAPLLVGDKRRLPQKLALAPRLQVKAAKAVHVVHLVDQPQETRGAFQRAANAVAWVLGVLLEMLPLEFIDHVQPLDALIIELRVRGVDPSILRRQDVAHHRLDRRADKGCRLAPGVGNSVLGLLEHVEDPQVPQVRVVPIQREHRVIGLVERVGHLGLLVRAPNSQPHIRREVDAAEEIVSLSVWLVRVIGQIVVFEAVDPIVVIQINAKEKLRPIDVVAQKWLVVVGNDIGRSGVVVLIEVGDEVVVLVPAGENRPVVGRAKADPIGEAVLVVVVFDELVQVSLGIVVLHVARGTDQEGSRRIGFVNGVGFAVEKVGEHIARDVEVPSVGPLGRNRVLFALVEQRGIGKLEIALVAVPLAVEVKAENPSALNGEAAD